LPIESFFSSDILRWEQVTFDEMMMMSLYIRPIHVVGFL